MSLAIGFNSGLISDSGQKMEKAVEAVYGEHPLQDSRRKKVARAVSYTTVMALSAFSDFPFIPVSMPLGKVLGPLCALGNSVTFFVLDYWSSKEVIRPVFGRKTQEELDLVESQEGRGSSPCRTTAMLTGAFVIALLAQIPHVLATMAYNDPDYRIAAGAVLGLAGALLPLRSLQLTLEEAVSKIRAREKREVEALREQVLAQLDSCHRAFIDMSSEDRRAFIARCEEAASEGERTAVLAQAETPRPSRPIGDRIRSVFNYAGLGLGAALALVLEYTSADYTFSETRSQVWDNSWAAGAFAALAVASTVHLVGLSIIRTTQRIFNFFGNGITGERVLNLSGQVRPKLSATLISLSALMNLAALGPNVVIWQDFYADSAIKRALFPSAICTALFLLFFTPTLDVVDEVVASSLAKGSEEERAVFRINKQFLELKRLVQECPAAELEGYLKTHEALLGKMSEATPDYGSCRTQTA